MIFNDHYPFLELHSGARTLVKLSNKSHILEKVNHWLAYLVGANSLSYHIAKTIIAQDPHFLF